jgi:hypothetical protein
LSAKVSLRDLAKALTGPGGKEFVIEKIIPRQGLDPMAKCFLETTRKSLRDTLNKVDPKLWSQIYSAFAVRHLIEHRKGKIDQRFLDEVVSRSFWRNSSWADFVAQPPRRGTGPARIEVREEDFEATFDAMVRAAKIMTDLTKECWLK